MNPGQYDKRILIQKKIVEHDSYNQPIEVWKDKHELYASIVNTGGGEFYAAQKLNAQTTAVFKTRFNKLVTVLDRIKYNGRIFEILWVNDVDEKHVELQISAKEVV